MADETTTKTRKARTNRVYGLALTVRILVPVDRKNLRSQIDASEAAETAIKNNDFSALLKMPGARIVPAGRNGGVLFGALPTAEEAAQEAEGEADEPASDEATEDASEAGTEAEATEEASTGRSRRRAA